MLSLKASLVVQENQPESDSYRQMCLLTAQSTSGEFELTAVFQDRDQKR